MSDRTAPRTAAEYDAIHDSFDAPEPDVQTDCGYCGREVPLVERDGELLCSACLAELEAADAVGSAASAATYAVARTLPSERFDPATSHVVARYLTWSEARALSRTLREADPEAVFTTFSAPLADQVDAVARAARAEAVEPTAADQVDADASDVAAHVAGFAPRFNVARKVDEAARYSRRLGSPALRIPSKLSGTAGLQRRIALVARHFEASGAASLATVLHVTREGGSERVAVLAAPNGEARGEDASRRGALLVGYVQDKHAAWLAPLLNATAAGTVTRAGTPVRVRITAVTGGTPERPTRGVNVALVGVADAVRGLWRRMEADAADADAYESGNRTRIEARMA